LGIAVPHPLPCAQLCCMAKQLLPSVFEKRTAKKRLPSVSARQRCKNWIFFSSQKAWHGIVINKRTLSSVARLHAFPSLRCRFDPKPANFGSFFRF
jgi:hypothetical protein